MGGVISAGSAAFALNVLGTNGTAETFLAQMSADWLAQGTVDLVGALRHAEQLEFHRIIRRKLG